MRRFSFSIVGLCFALAACGDKFVSHSGSGGNGGTSGAAGGSGFAPAAGEAGEGGSAGGDNSAGAAAEAGEGDGGAGALGNGGSGGLLVDPAGGTSGTDGVAGSAGVGGGSVEPPIPQSGLLVWLRADVGVEKKDGFVQAWADQSDKHTNAMQTTVAARPVYLATGFNGRPTLEFDGQGQFLKFNDGFGNFSNGIAGFIVAKPTKSDCAAMVEFSNGSEIDDISLGMWQDKWTYEVESPYLQLGSVDHERFSLYSINHHQAGSSELHIDGSNLGSMPMPTPVVPSSGSRVFNFIGHTLYANGCEYFKGQLSEIIVYSRELSNIEMSAIEKYLDLQWSLSKQDLPTPNP